MSSKKSSNSKLFQLISALNGQLDLIGEDYADILWLTLKQNQYQKTPVEPEPPKIKTSQLKVFQFSYLWLNFVENGPHNFVYLLFPPKIKRDFIPPPPPPEPKVPIQPKSSTQKEIGGVNEETLPLRHPDPPSIQSPLEFAKALRPLIRKVSSGRKTLLDEAQTVQKTAEQQICIPVFQNEPEPWLDLALVIDNSPSMVIWSSTIKELKKILSGYGIFREARIWDLIVDDKGTVNLSSRYGKKERIHNPQQLVDPTRRRLILIVSDCVNPIWFDGSLLTTLKAWTKHQPLAIVQMLPNLMWQMTGLKIGAFVELSNLIPGTANRNLCIQELLIWKKLNLERGTKVPVLTLNPEVTSLWSDFTVGKYGAISPGFVFPVKSEFDRIPKPAKSAQAQIVELSAEDRVKRFRSISSPTGRNLAGFLVSAPIITLPVVRLIQKLFLHDSEPVHVAEVFLGGILKPTIHVTRETNPDGIVFDVADDDIRPILLEDFPWSDSVQVFKKISQFIEANLGKTLAECVGLLANPNQSGKEDALARAYGEISLKVLDGLGGENKKFADRIRQTASLGNRIITPSTDLVRLTRKVALRSPKVLYRSFNEEVTSDVFAIYRGALNAVNNALSRSSWVEVVDEDEQSDFQLLINEQGQFEIADAERKAFTNIRPLLAAEVNHSERTAKRLVHMAQFNIIEQLDNPDSDLSEYIEFELCDQNKNPYQDPENISISLNETTYLRLKNNSSGLLYCTVLDLEPTWEISVIPYRGNNIYFLEPGEEKYQGLIFQLPEDKLYDSAIETLKLFVYNDERPPFELLTLPSLDRNLENETRISLGVSQRLARLDAQAREFLQFNSLSKLLTNISGDIDTPETNTRGDSYDLKSQSDVDWTTKKIKLTRFNPKSREIIIKNTFTPAKPGEQGESRWDWRVYLDNEPQLLDEIDRVEYTLHETFEDRFRTVNNRQNNFALESNGWGEFEIQVKVFFKDERIRELYHWLYLGLTFAKVLVLFADSESKNRELLTETINEAGDRQKFWVKPVVIDDEEQIRDSVIDFVTKEPRNIPIIFHYIGIQASEQDLYSLDTLDSLFSTLESKVSCVLINGVHDLDQVETINKYVDYVIGMDRQRIEDEEIEDEEIEDEEIAFCRGFYRAFGNGRTIENALEVGKNEIFIEGAKSIEGLSPPPASLDPILYRRNSMGFDLQPLTVTTAKIHFEEDLVLEFETITVNSSGQAIRKENHQNTYFKEELGEAAPSLIMMAIPEGKFVMGSPEDKSGKYKRESPQHQVKVAPYWLAQTPVTVAQWNFVVSNLRQEQRELNPKKAEGKGQHPVNRVSWYDAMEFCARLARSTGLNYRLPSEAEWEYACRSVIAERLSLDSNDLTIEEWNEKYSHPFYFGETITGQLANYDSSETYADESAWEWRGKTLPVKYFPPNAFGLYDMHGQVWEWCADPWHKDYRKAPQDRDSSVWDEISKKNNHYQHILDNLSALLNDKRSRVRRGGSYHDIPMICRSAYRSGNSPDYVNYFYGFRLAVSDRRIL